MKTPDLGGFDFGLTNDPERLAAAHAFRAAAVADGWHIGKPHGFNEEPIEVWAKLWRDSGWIMHILARTFEDGGTYKYQVAVDIWAPDKLAVKSPLVYHGAVIREGAHRCNVCGAEGVTTTRFSFAGRACVPCASQPELQNFSTT